MQEAKCFACITLFNNNFLCNMYHTFSHYTDKEKNKLKKTK